MNDADTSQTGEIGAVEQQIREKLSAHFAPTELEIKNESHLHQHHKGSPGTGESHFRVKIVAAAFTDMNRIGRHREINRILAEELAGPVHALAIKAMAPGE